MLGKGIMTPPTRTCNAFPAVWVDDWLAAVTSNPEIQVIGRWTRVHIVIECGAESLAVEFDRGSVQQVSPSPTTTADRVVFSGTRRAWDSMLVPDPEPRCNDVLALDRHDAEFEVVEGRDVLIKHLRILLAIFRIAAQSEGRLR